MATPYASPITTLVAYRIHRAGAIAMVRVHIGEQPSGNCVGELLLRPSEFHLWRASLRDHDPARFSTWYADGVYEWLHSGTALEAEVAS